MVIEDPKPCPTMTSNDPEGGLNHIHYSVPQWCWLSHCSHLSHVIQDPEPCPITTYNDQEGGMDSSACLPCPPGYLCDVTGIANYTIHPCPVGSYCTNATSASIVCPPGRYRYGVAWER